MNETLEKFRFQGTEKPPTKDALVQVKVPSEMREIMERAASEEGVPLSAWMRQAALDRLDSE